MTFITAIELENFQSIEARTRIEFRPITLLYGPNSAGKSAVFDAIELLRVLLDPTALDEARAASMVDRWARRRAGPWREMFLAVEFPFVPRDPSDIWWQDSNWLGRHKSSDTPAFTPEYFLNDSILEEYGIHNDDAEVRIELSFGVADVDGTSRCHLLECVAQIGTLPVLKITRTFPGGGAAGSPTDRQDVMGQPLEGGDGDDEDQDEGEGAVEASDSAPEEAKDVEVSRLRGFDGRRWLELSEEIGFLSSSILPLLKSKTVGLIGEDRTSMFREVGGFYRVNSEVEINVSPLRMTEVDLRFDARVVADKIVRNGEDVVFYLCTLLWTSIRNRAPIVRADRRSPRPEEALTFVDLGLEGWWAKSSMSPSSPAALLKTQGKPVDEHFQGLAEAAHAALLLRAASGGYPWGDDHANKHVAPVRAKAEILDRVNHHLERSLFSEKLYRLECASTLMVPIDLDEDDPWTYYALAQPAAVRLYLRETSGEKVDLQDVGSGVSYVLPVLYALSRQGLVQVQQPELHLHPALQASVGDIFIEELHRSGFGQLLIETHSEHILLRLLRRIRDTEKGRVLSDDVKLNNEQLAVYYFDPRPDGGTFVSRQLVTPLGDFYNDWPRGFFAERNKDLFDEE